MVEEHRQDPGRRILQKRLAEEVTCMVHSAEDLEMAKEASNILFGKSTKESLLKLDEQTFLDVFNGFVKAGALLKVNRVVFHLHFLGQRYEKSHLGGIVRTYGDSIHCYRIFQRRKDTLFSERNTLNVTDTIYITPWCAALLIWGNGGGIFFSGRGKNAPWVGALVYSGLEILRFQKLNVILLGRLHVTQAVLYDELWNWVYVGLYNHRATHLFLAPHFVPTLSTYEFQTHIGEEVAKGFQRNIPQRILSHNG